MADKIITLPYVKTCMQTVADKLSGLFHKTAAAHNSIYRGKQITFNDSISEQIGEGTFDDIYVGDGFYFRNVAYSYTDENNTTQSDTYTGLMRVMELDYFTGFGSDLLGNHHIVVAPDNILFSAKMNDTSTTAGGYVGAKMRTVHLKRAEAIFKACFGSNSLLSHKDYLINAVTNGKPTGGAWIDSAVDLMDERMVDGSCIYDSGNSDGTTVPNRNSIASSQFAAFRYDHKLFRNAENYWLRNVVSGTNFAVINHFGASANANASNVFGVRPYALVS